MVIRSMSGMWHLGALLNGATISGVGLVACGWAVWHRRVTWRIPHDRALTLAVVFGAATLFFSSPAQYNYMDGWLFALTGIDHVAGFLGQLCSLAALCTCIYAAISRLVPDEKIEPMMRKAEYPVALAILLMLIAFANTGELSRRGQPDMMRVPRDAWLTLSWVVYLCTAIYLSGFLTRLLLVLRTDPRSRSVATLLALGSALTIGTLAAAGWAMITPIPSAMIWAIGGAAVISWSLAAYWSVRLRFQRTEREDPE